NAQVINFDSLSTFPKSVVLRVYDVGMRVPLTVSEQIALAGLFNAEEEEVYDELQSGISEANIDAIRLNYVNSFNAILSRAKLEEYYDKKALGKANALAGVKSNMLQLKYNTDDTLVQYFKTIYA